MANLIVTDNWKAYVLSQMILAANIEIGLFTNTAFTWNHATTIGDLTEVAWTGYARISSSGWSVPALDGSFDSYSNASAVTFTNGGATSVTVTGVFYFDSVSSNLVGGNVFTDPVVVSPAMSLSIVPELQTQSQF
jgi:hypothetical protein